MIRYVTAGWRTSVVMCFYAIYSMCWSTMFLTIDLSVKMMSYMLYLLCCSLWLLIMVKYMLATHVHCPK